MHTAKLMALFWMGFGQECVGGVDLQSCGSGHVFALVIWERGPAATGTEVSLPERVHLQKCKGGHVSKLCSEYRHCSGSHWCLWV